MHKVESVLRKISAAEKLVLGIIFSALVKRSAKYRMNETHATSMPSTHKSIRNHAKITLG